MIPTATATTGSGAIRAFTPGQVALATFFGGPVAGGVLMFINHRRAGQANAGLFALLVGIVLTAVLLALGIAIQSPVGNFLAIGGIVAMMQFAKVQEPKLGPSVKASGWAAFGIGMASLVLIGGTAIGYFVMAQPPSVDFNNGEEVQYAGGATESEARALGNLLKEEGYFDGSNAATVRVEHDHGETVVSFVVKDGAWNDPSTTAAFQTVRHEIADKLYPERVVIVQVCDDTFEVKTTLR